MTAVAQPLDYRLLVSVSVATADQGHSGTSTVRRVSHNPMLVDTLFNRSSSRFMIIFPFPRVVMLLSHPSKAGFEG
ncbi:hypothetical protein PM082_013139 [Marasmius tenuissimus]|nr:hypothetical protein PM082_013139 [Marasmius tenuissimus]